MKKLLIKTGIFGFVCSLGASMLFTSKDMHFGIGTTVLPRSWGEYSFVLLRFSILFAISLVLLTFLYKYFRQKNINK